MVTIGMIFANNALLRSPVNNVKPMNDVGTNDPSISRVLRVKRKSDAGEPLPVEGTLNGNPSKTRKAKWKFVFSSGELKTPFTPPFQTSSSCMLQNIRTNRSTMRSARHGIFVE